jgi:sarcosine oxidase subunit gamma
MAERYLRQGPLAHLELAARVGAGPTGARVTLCDRGFLDQLVLRGTGDEAFGAAVEAVLEVAPPTVPNRVHEKGAARILWLGPDEWLVVTPAETGEGLARRLVERLAGQFAAVTTLSEGRAAMGIAGPGARAVLAQGCSVDLHPRAFQPGHCAQTLLARVPVLLHQRDVAPTYDLYVQRSMAEYLWAWLEDAGRDEGIAVVEG